MIDNILKSDDPLRELGPGISSFHRLLIMIFVLFFILCCLHLSVLTEFRAGGFYGDIDGWIVKTGLGNLGFSTTSCQSSSMIQGNTDTFRCTSGEISDLVDWGIVTQYEDSNLCARRDDLTCLPILNDKKMNDWFKKECKNKTECIIKDFSSLVHNNTGSRLVHKSCTIPQARIFF